MRHKYHAIATEVEGRKFASRREAKRYSELRLLERVKAIGDLECQPVFPLCVVKVYKNGWPIEIAIVAKYIADFQYTNLKTGEIVVEDVKGFKTPVYALKKKLVEAIHGITVTEI